MARPTILLSLVLLGLTNLQFGHGEYTSTRKYLDLGYSFSTNTIFYPGPKTVPFKLTRDHEEWRKNGSFWYSSFSFCMGEHGGTHLDAPYHFSKDGWTIDQIPSSHLIDIPAIIVNVQPKVLTNDENPLVSPGGDFKLSVADLMNHEKEFGRIPSRSLVLMFTGWSKYWPNYVNYLGYQKKGSGFTVRFPSVSVDAMRWLSEERQIVGIGLDAPSLDGSDEMNPVHVYGASRKIFNLKNVANLHVLVGKKQQIGLRAFILPLKIDGGSGAPVRILVELP